MATGPVVRTPTGCPLGSDMQGLHQQKSLRPLPHFHSHPKIRVKSNDINHCLGFSGGSPLAPQSQVRMATTRETGAFSQGPTSRAATEGDRTRRGGEGDSVSHQSECAVPQNITRNLRPLVPGLAATPAPDGQACRASTVLPGRIHAAESPTVHRFSWKDERKILVTL